MGVIFVEIFQRFKSYHGKFETLSALKEGIHPEDCMYDTNLLNKLMAKCPTDRPSATNLLEYIITKLSIIKGNNSAHPEQHWDAMSASSTMLTDAMVEMALEGSQFDAKHYDSKTQDMSIGETEELFTSYDDVVESFEDMGLRENLLRGIYAYGFEKPSAIQQRGIVPFCKGLDIIQLSQSGTGNTATFCFGILEQLDYSLVECQALVLVPTRELAQQIEEAMHALGAYLGVKVHACIGRTSASEDHKILARGVHVVAGDPGCAVDLLRRQSLRPDHIKVFVLDETEQMLSHGFKDQIYDIFQLLPAKIQVGVFSAIMPPEALEITRKFMNKPVRILVESARGAERSDPAADPAQR